MTSSRKKQDEKNLKTIRELGALPQNKYCFDCNQRGPTYVNVTIGSFVCTKCSGMLRGITPPHRVKSISMATFSTDEVDLLRSRGNAYCRRVWLGLHDDASPTPSSDETSIKDFMIEKYERKRYYLDPVHVTSEVRHETKPVKINGGQIQLTQRSRPEIKRNNAVNRGGLVNGNAFVADFDRADIFGGGATTLNSSNNNDNKTLGVTQQNGFANFDDNPVFSNTTGAGTTTTDAFSIFDLSYNDFYGPLLNEVPLFPKCSTSTSRWTLPPPTSFNHHNNWSTLQDPTPALQNGSHNGTSNGTLNGSLNDTLNYTLNGSSNGVPAEDKYAALKDLDNEIKSQKNGQVDWSSTGSNGSLYSSPTPTGSVYSSPSPQGSIFGSPSQGQFMTAFPPTHESNPSNVSNPFGSNGAPPHIWGHPNGTNNQPQQHQAFANPFRDLNAKSNGFSQVFQPIAAYPVNGTNGVNGWAQNPFTVGGTNLNSNNPFL